MIALERIIAQTVVLFMPLDRIDCENEREKAKTKSAEGVAFLYARLYEMIADDELKGNSIRTIKTPQQVREILKVQSL